MVILTECDIELAVHEVYRPTSAAGGASACRSAQSAARARAPDWVCEILSSSNAATDQVDKFRVYGASGVPFFYWIIDPERKILTVYRFDGGQYQSRFRPSRARP